MLDLDPRRDFEEWRSTPIEDLKDIMIGEGRIIKIRSTLSPKVEFELVSTLRRNVVVSAWSLRLRLIQSSCVTNYLWIQKLSRLANVEEVRRGKKEYDSEGNP